MPWGMLGGPPSLGADRDLAGCLPTEHVLKRRVVVRAPEVPKFGVGREAGAHAAEGELDGAEHRGAVGADGRRMLGGGAVRRGGDSRAVPGGLRGGRGPGRAGWRTGA